MSDVAYNFEWDAKKAHTNATKHGVTFEQAAHVFFDPLALTIFDDAHSQHEERWFTLGNTPEGALLAIAHTHQATSSHSIRVRIISARPATKQERRFYSDDPR